MGKYTEHECERIDDKIDSQLHLITNTILENIPGVKSIVLAGGFGKGEGSVEITQDGEIRLLRDFDIVAIVDKIPKEKTQSKIYEEINESLGIHNPEGELFRFSDFVVCVYFRREQDLIYPDVWFYDLKSESRLLYGKDVRCLIPWGRKDIPLSSGLRLLYEKVCGLLGVFSYIYIKAEKIPEQKRKLLIFECYKTFIEICTALSILASEYEPKYATRARNFPRFYFDKFPDLAQVLPELPAMVKTYTDFKLKPDFAKTRERPIELWFSARDSLGAVLRVYLRRFLGITLSKWKDLPDQAKILARHYYKPFLGPLIYKRLRFSNSVMLNLASVLYQTLTNVEYSYVVTRYTQRVYLQPLCRISISPSLKFFQAGIMTLFSLNRDGTIEKDLLEKAARELRRCIPVDISMFDTSGWETVRKQFLKAYSLCTGYHFVK